MFRGSCVCENGSATVLESARDPRRRERETNRRYEIEKLKGVCADLRCAVGGCGRGGDVGGAGGVRGHMYDVGSTFVSVILEAG